MSKHEHQQQSQHPPGHETGGGRFPDNEKVPEAQVTSQNDLARINNLLAKYGQVPQTVVLGWRSELNTWQNNLEAGSGPEHQPGGMPCDVAAVTPAVEKACDNYDAFKAGKSGGKTHKV